jgi:hypothetical protein
MSTRDTTKGETMNFCKFCGIGIVRENDGWTDVYGENDRCEENEDAEKHEPMRRKFERQLVGSSLVIG